MRRTGRPPLENASPEVEPEVGTFLSKTWVVEGITPCERVPPANDEICLGTRSGVSLRREIVAARWQLVVNESHVFQQNVPVSRGEQSEAEIAVVMRDCQLLVEVAQSLTSPDGVSWSTYPRNVN